MIQYSVEIMIHGNLMGLCSVPEACGMGGNGEMHAQVVCVPPVLLSLYVNTRSWSQPFYIFPRQLRCRRANNDYALRFQSTNFDMASRIQIFTRVNCKQVLNK